MNSFINDVKYAFRTLPRKPIFTIGALLCLGLSIAVVTAVVSMIGTVFLRPLFPLENSHRLVTVYSISDDGGYYNYQNPGLNYMDWKIQNRSFEEMAAFEGSNKVLHDSKGGLQLSGLSVTPDIFNVLRLNPFMGRTLLPSEGWPGPDDIVVLSHAVWKNRFGSDPNIVGRAITLSEKAYTVVGIMPPDLKFLHFGVDSISDRLDTDDLVDYWIPISRNVAGDYGGRGAYNWYVIARLKAGVTVSQANTDLNVIARRIRQQYSDSSHAVKVVPLQQAFGRTSRRFLYLLFGAAGFVLIIGCGNVINLFLVQVLTRRHEFSIRTALGAGRLRVVRQLFTESLLIAVLGGLVGLVLSAFIVEFIVKTTSVSIPRLDEVSINRYTIGFVLFISLVAGCFLGIVSAFNVFVTNLSDSLREGSHGATDRIGRRRLVRLLVGLEFSLTLILFIGASLLGNSFFRSMQIELGYDTENILTMKINDASPEFTRQILQRVEALPGVESAAVALGLPLCRGDRGSNFDCVAGAPNVRMRWISPGYLKTMGIELIYGRNFSDKDNTASSKVVIVGEQLARQMWPGENPIGRRFKHYGLAGYEQSYEIIGVIRNVKNRIDKEQLDAYACSLQEPVAQYHLAVRTSSDPVGLIEPIRSEIKAIDRDVSVSDVKLMDERFSDIFAGLRFLMMLFVIFSVVGIVFAVTGIYGVTAYSVSRRTQEIGIRMAMGASRNEVLKLVLREGLILVLLGSAIGLPGAFALTRLVASQLYGISATDPWTYGVVTLMLAAVAILASYIPAHRAAKTDPMEALRYE